MKFEFNMAVKAVPVADVKVSVDCSVEELAIILADPVYQDLGKTLIAKLSQVQVNRSNHQHGYRKQSDCQQEVRETFQKRQHEARREHDEAVKKVLRTINDRMDALRRNGKPGWGEL